MRLVVPDALQELEPILQCGPKYYKREFGARGDISGTYVTLSYGTTASKEQVEEQYNLAELSEALKAQHVIVVQEDVNSQSNCLNVDITAYIY